MFYNLILRILAAVLLIVLLSAPVAVCEGNPDGVHGVENSEQCAGLVYRTKINEVVVYAEPDTSSRQLAVLELGQEVCYVGEEGDFAILHWEAAESKRASDEENNLAFTRAVNLRKSSQPKRSEGPDSPSDPFKHIRELVSYIASGGVPDDVLAPYGPIGRLFRNYPSSSDSEEDSGSNDESTKESIENND